MTLKYNVRAAVSSIEAAKREYHRLAFDEDLPDNKGQPCPESKLAKLEHRWGHKLPPSYRAFLEVCNGWKDFSGGSDLLPADGHAREWVRERVDDMAELFNDSDAENPFEHGALPLLLGEETTDVLYADPRTARTDGEMDIVDLDIIEEVHRFPHFLAYLEHRVAVLNRLVAEERRTTRRSSR